MCIVYLLENKTTTTITDIKRVSQTDNGSSCSDKVAILYVNGQVSYNQC